MSSFLSVLKSKLSSLKCKNLLSLFICLLNPLESQAVSLESFDDPIAYAKDVFWISQLNIPCLPLFAESC